MMTGQGNLDENPFSVYPLAAPGERNLMLRNSESGLPLAIGPPFQVFLSLPCLLIKYLHRPLGALPVRCGGFDS